jgi:polyhydroxyalkanoate synthesis regulator phasin
MDSDAQAQMERIDELGRRVEHLEHHLVTRDVLDEEIRSLERRLREVRELTEG